VVLALILYALPGGQREGIARVIRGTLLRPVLALQQGTVERAARFDNPDRLRAERDSLAAFLIGNTTLITENRELRSLLGLRDRLAYSFVPAEIIRIPERGAEGYFQLTSGSDHGVRPGAPIVTPSGLVGRVRDTDRQISFGIDWMNPEFRASAMTVDGTVYGLAEPRIGRGGEPMLALTGTPRHVELADGTVIVTSGIGGVFPRGIPIGTIAGAEGAETSWARTYLIQPAVSPSEMTYVLVLGEPHEGLAGRDLAEGWGIRVQPPPAVDTTLAGAAAAAPAIPAPPPPPPPQQEIVIPQVQVGPPTPVAPPLLGQPVEPADGTP
jgi:rod shape-determining protein MreC